MRKSWIALALVFCCAAPAFAMDVTVPDAGLRLQIYGYVRADLSHDTQATAPKGDFAFFVLPEADGEKDAQTHFGARESRLGLNLSGPDSGNWKTTGKFEMDFYGGDKANSYNPRMRLAYLDLAHASGLSLRFGQDWDTFCELMPRIVNFAYLADIGALGLRRPQARATQELKLAENTKLVAKVAAAQTVGEDLDGGTFEDGADADWPTVQWSVALLQKLWTEKSAKVAFGGHYGRETVDGVEKTATTNAFGTVTEVARVIETDATDYDTWSAQGSIFLPLTKQFAVQANIWKGENLDTYYGGIGQGVNVALGREIEAQGGWAQLLWDPTDKLAFGFGYSVDDPKDEDLAEGRPSKNEQIFGNVAYKLTPAVTAMAEYAHMTTDYLGKDEAVNDRVQLAMKYAF
ncbi:MAG TPA: hypothetical protein P5204_07815 [Kiritimatiellia bacterium]|nr:hypothetical protein [Kiritimatiellia bacterium]